MKKLALVLLVSFTAIAATADTWMDDRGFTWSYSISRNEATITGISPKEGEMPPIPSELGGRPVTSIGGNAFYGCSGFTGSLTIGDSVTSIGQGAFSGCSGFTGVYVDDIVSWMGISFEDEDSNPLRYAHNLYVKGSLEEGKLTIPDGVTYVGGFYGCTGLKEIELPNTVTNIGDRAFQDCTELVNVNMPSNIKKIGEYAFSGCHKLLKLEWLPGVTVGQYAFQNCKSWQGVFNVPAGVTGIAEGTFDGCSGLQQINLPDGITTIGGRAFADCSSLADIRLPQGLKEISYAMFVGCENLSKVMIPDSVIRIGYGAFEYCQRLVSLEIPYGVTTLGGYAFYDSGLQIVTVPSTLVNVDREAFYGSYCSQVIFDGDLPVGYELWSNMEGKSVAFPRASGSRGLVTWPVTQFMGYTQENAPVVTIVSSKIRENDPEVLDVVYKVTSTKPTVKVRALAFEDGVRSFANVVRPEDFIADLNGNETSGNVGDAVTANEEHTLSWKVSSDWATRLAKVSFEVLATEDDILPLELMTIPGTASHPETWQISWNYITADKSFEALLWLYADKDLGLTLQNGVLKNGDTRLCSGASVSAFDALVYIYGKMGFQLLDGDALSYVKEATRFDLPDKSGRQYAYRVVTGE